MKKFVIGAFVLSSSFSANVFAAPAAPMTPETPRQELLTDLKAEVLKCAVQLVRSVNSAKTVVGYHSLCPTLKIQSRQMAQVFIDGDWLTVKIADSKESDGGDLDDMGVFNSRGTLIAKKLNIAAYDDVVIAMAGTSQLKMSQVP